MSLSLHNHLQHALSNLYSAKLRSFLAVLGISVGTASMVALLSCSQLATEKAMAQFKALGTDFVSISLFQPTTPNTHQRNIPLSVFRQLPKQIPNILNIAAYSTAYPSMYYSGKAVNGVIVGADEALAEALKLKLQAGHFISSIHSFERVCVIGAGIAQSLKNTRLNDPIGQALQVGSTLYTIIGVLAPCTDNAFFNGDINQSVIVPILGMSLISPQASINNALIRLSSEKALGTVRTRLQDILYEQAPALNVVMRTPQEIITRMSNQARIFKLLLAVIGCIALLVGGIGIMNVTLMSVAERTKEIGLRKALGATRMDIQILFLMESTLLAIFGGLLGITAGELFTRIVAMINQWPFIFYLWPICISLMISMLTGVFFGYYPASRASKLTAMVCLRDV